MTTTIVLDSSLFGEDEPILTNNLYFSNWVGSTTNQIIVSKTGSPFEQGPLSGFHVVSLVAGEPLVYFSRWETDRESLVTFVYML